MDVEQCKMKILTQETEAISFCQILFAGGILKAKTMAQKPDGWQSVEGDFL